MQNGQIKAKAALASISGEISCRPVSTGGTKNRFEHFLHETLF
jgi:hypothetical protein